MTGSGSPCGACKFLRRKCVRGCVFAPYFCHEQGAAHFAAIHKVFGASNVSKLLAHLPVSDRCEAAVTISYEAQARLQDPIYGCVSHIFALQQQVVSLQAQLAFLKEQAAGQSFGNGYSSSGNPNEKSQGKYMPNLSQDLQSWFQQGNCGNNFSRFDSNNLSHNYNQSGSMSQSSMSNCQNYSAFQGDNISSANYEEGSQSMDSFEIQTREEHQWGAYPDDNMEDLQSVAFRYIHH
ncbi:OLC1v1007084C1 [Oldenlandia corymbosa var. corymbosa]|uniref:OLC1v1007084C1 n=1 Tax=Oldenlandia corymbosa var. corymbosa TaxID=529605 RepID=A0AAV1DK13_OLDCO|nr:OLC1v1007084C1 [Oldenlandia corymbosa var. corymbosa]